MFLRGAKGVPWVGKGWTTFSNVWKIKDETFQPLETCSAAPSAILSCRFFSCYKERLVIFQMDFVFAIKAFVVAGGLLVTIYALCFRVLTMRDQKKTKRFNENVQAMMDERSELNDEQFGALFLLDQGETAIRIRVLLMETFSFDGFQLKKLRPEDTAALFLFGTDDPAADVYLGWIEFIMAVEELFSIEVPDKFGEKTPESMSFRQVVDGVSQLRRAASL